MYSKNAGYLYVAPTRTEAGKLIDTWSFKTPFHQTKKPELTDKLKVEVYIHKAGSSIHFVAKSPGLAREVTDTDISRLRDTVEALLQKQHDLHAQCTWQPWLEVKVSKHKSSLAGDAGLELSLSYRRLLKGIDAQGKEWTVNFNGVAVEFPNPKTAGLEESKAEGFGSMAFRSGRPVDDEVSYIPENDENIQALESLIQRFHALHAVMAKFLSQEAIGQSLESSQLTKLLPQA